METNEKHHAAAASAETEPWEGVQADQQETTHAAPDAAPAPTPTARIVFIDDKQIPIPHLTTAMTIDDLQTVLTPVFPMIARVTPTVEIIEQNGMDVQKVSWAKRMGSNAVDSDELHALLSNIRNLPSVVIRCDQQPLPHTITSMLTGTMTIDQGIATLPKLYELNDIITTNEQAGAKRQKRKEQHACDAITTLPSVAARTPVAW